MKRLSEWTDHIRETFGLGREETQREEIMKERLGIGATPRIIEPPEAPSGLIGKPFEPLSARVYYSPELNRYINRDTGLIESWDQYQEDLKLWRSEHLDFIVRLTHPKADEAEVKSIRDAIDKIRADEELSTEEQEGEVGELLGS